LITILLIIILVILIIIASILLIPFHITLKFGNKGLKYDGLIKITWIKIRILQRVLPPEEKEKEEKKEGTEEKETKSEWNLDRIVKVINLFLDALPYFEKILLAVIRSVNLERFWLDIKFGLDSPVDTAQIAGFFWSMSSVINVIPRVSVNVSPEFFHTTLNGSFELEFRIRLFWIVFEAIRAFTKKPVRSLINEIRA
jgi:hypothetical protein